jgi:hypothetical protein
MTRTHMYTILDNDETIMRRYSYTNHIHTEAVLSYMLQYTDSLGGSPIVAARSGEINNAVVGDRLILFNYSLRLNIADYGS